MYTAATFAAVTLASVGLVVASPEPAQAAGTCYYSSCYNQDPNTTNCAADARTIGWPSGNTEIRFSPSCQATWLRDVDGFSWVSTLTQYTYSSNKTLLYSVNIPWAGYSGTWTKMVPMGTSGLTQYKANGWWSGLYNTL